MKTGLWTASRLAMMAAAGACGMIAATPANADVNIVDTDGITVDLQFTGAAGLFTVGDAQFGAGIPDTSGSIVRDFQWMEVFVKPGITASLQLGDFGAVYTGFSAIGALTRGDGDAAGTTFDEPESLELEDAYAGWRSGTLFPVLGENGLDVSFGRQSFALGDGFILADGNADGGTHGAYWMGARTAWANSVIVRIGADTPLHADAFWLRSDSDTSRDEIYGANLEYTHEGIGTVGAAYFKVEDSRVASRRDLDVYDLRAALTPLPMAPDFSLAAEVAFQEGGEGANDASAHAWYVEPAYTFSEVPWTPRVAYRYATFSGDETGSTENEGYDPLHYGMLGGWGTWFQGEIVGEYMWGNSNLNSHRIHVSMAPMETVTVGAMAYRFTFDEPAAAGVTDDHLADELNVYVDWGVNDYLAISAVAGYAWAGEGGKQLTGGTDDSQLFQLLAFVTF